MSSLEPHFTGTPIAALPPRPRLPIHVVLDNLRSAYNVGSMFRTADAAGVAHIHLCGMTAHPPHLKLEKTALGAHDYIPWTYYERNRDCMDRLDAENIPVVSIEVTGDAIPYPRFVWPKPVAVVFGNEVNGVNERVLRRSRTVVSIPMLGYKNSLNVATTFGIILYAILGQWEAI